MTITITVAITVAGTTTGISIIGIAMCYNADTVVKVWC